MCLNWWNKALNKLHLIGQMKFQTFLHLFQTFSFRKIKLVVRKKFLVSLSDHNDLKFYVMILKEFSHN